MANIETLRSGLSFYLASDCRSPLVLERRTCRRDAGFPSGPRGRGSSALTNLQGSAQLTIFRSRLPEPLAYSGAQTETSSSVSFRLTHPAAQALRPASEIRKNGDYDQPVRATLPFRPQCHPHRRFTHPRGVPGSCVCCSILSKDEAFGKVGAVNFDVLIGIERRCESILAI